MTVRGYKMKVTNVDRLGKRKGPVQWVDVPRATRCARGFAQVESFVVRVLSSNARSSWAIFSTKSGNTSISVGKYKGAITLGMTVEVRSRARERALRAFFEDRGILPSRDYLAKNGGVPDATRVLDYPMPKHAGTIAEMAVDLLRSVHRLKESTTLDIRFEEHEAG